jgi:hypothetical protein
MKNIRNVKLYTQKQGEGFLYTDRILIFMVNVYKNFARSVQQNQRFFEWWGRGGWGGGENQTARQGNQMVLRHTF